MAIIDFFIFVYYCRFYRGLYAHEVWGHVGHVQRCASRDLWSQIGKNSLKCKFQTAADARRANASMLDRKGLNNYKTQKKSVLFGFPWKFWHLKVGSLWSKSQKSARLVEIYQIYVCFDLEFGRELKFKIIRGQIRSFNILRGCLAIIIRPIFGKGSVQNWPILKIWLSLAKTFGTLYYRSIHPNLVYMLEKEKSRKR